MVITATQITVLAVGTSGGTHAATTGAPSENTSGITGVRGAQQGSPRQEIRKCFIQHVMRRSSVGEAERC